MSRVARLLRSLGLPPDLDAPGPRTAQPFHRLRWILGAHGIDAASLEPVDEEGQAWQEILRRVEAVPAMDGAGQLDESAPILPQLEGALDVHQALEVLLVDHRIALMDADLSRAEVALMSFAEAMQRHVDVEDVLVLPAYRRSAPEAGWPRGAAPEIVDNEHRKISARLPELRRAVRDLADRSLAPGPRKAACLELLDREKVFHDLLEHHDLRERAFVYPHLEAALDEDEKARVRTELLRLWPRARGA